MSVLSYWCLSESGGGKQGIGGGNIGTTKRDYIGTAIIRDYVWITIRDYIGTSAS